MELRLIDGLALYCDLKKSEELARQWYLDTPPDSPLFSTYKAKMHERTSLKEMVSAQPTIDPLHALGACYCRECKYAYINSFSAMQGTALCKYWTNRSEGVQAIMSQDGFCSYGEPKEQEETR